MNNSSGRLSFFVLIACCLFLAGYRITNIQPREISWDILGYYLPLPQTFIYDDPLLEDTGWIEHVNSEYHLSGTLYQVGRTPEGRPVYFFLFGMALFFLPFFLAGHAIVPFTDYPPDGFSYPYQVALVVGGIIYTIIGLIWFRKILRNYFSEKITVIVLLLIVFGTNYIHHLTLKNLETVNVLFMLSAIIVWNTIQWHKMPSLKYLMPVGIGITLMALVKPSEILIILIPLLWNVASRQDLRKKILLLKEERIDILKTVFVCFLITVPQMLYWYEKTGSFIYDPYKNPGVGLDLLSPHIADTLFSYRKGWLLYTPVMIFSLIGFVLMFRNNRRLFIPVFIYFIISFYIISSWTEWWYGAGFSNRPVIAMYPVLGLALGYFILFISRKNTVWKTVAGVLAIMLVFLNQFQWWQLKAGILDPYRTTGAYYHAIFLRTKADDKVKDHLLVYRDFFGTGSFTDKEQYEKRTILYEDFGSNQDSAVFREPWGNAYLRIETSEYHDLFKQEFNKVTNHDHLWIKVSVDIRIRPGSTGELPLLVTTMERKSGPYGYRTIQLSSTTPVHEWVRLEAEYLTPEIRSGSDRLKVYIWNRGRVDFDIDNIRIDVYENQR